MCLPPLPGASPTVGRKAPPWQTNCTQSSASGCRDARDLIEDPPFDGPCQRAMRPEGQTAFRRIFPYVPTPVGSCTDEMGSCNAPVGS